MENNNKGNNPNSGNHMPKAPVSKEAVAPDNKPTDPKSSPTSKGKEDETKSPTANAGKDAQAENRSSSSNKGSNL